MSHFIEAIDINPLLRDFPVDIDRAEWWQRITNDPFRGEDLSTLSELQRDLLLDRFGSIYAPTKATVEIAYQIHRMVVGGWIDRNPYRDDQRKAIYQLADCGSRGNVNLPCISTSPRGMLIQGVTKQGKTRIIDRALAQYPQVIRRPKDERAGWLGLDQLVYLVIPMPTDASKTGFLMQAFIELDKALGTSYAKETTIRNGTIDAQLVQLLAKLALHRCGLLIIEEAQESNELSKNRFGKDFHTFFLRVLNTGIPTILLGNPLAFTELKTSSQLMSRLSDPGQYILEPAATHKSTAWTKDLVPNLWGKTLLPEPDEPVEKLDEFLWNATGGFTHYLSVLRRETLRAAFNAKAQGVTMAHVNEALKTSVMKEGRLIINSYWSGRAQGEVAYTDIPGIPDTKVIAVRGKRGSR